MINMNPTLIIITVKIDLLYFYSIVNFIISITHHLFNDTTISSL